MSAATTKTLFGTDGIRGRYGAPPLEPAFLERLGFCLVRHLAGTEAAPAVLLGRDTRASGPAIEEAVGRGIVRAGGRAVQGGVLTTPAVAHLVQRERFAGAVVISASHNPASDNGVKLLDRAGRKLPDALEARIEADLLSETSPPPVEGGTVEDRPLARAFVQQVTAARAPFARPLKVVLDCAHGAAHWIGPALYRGLGLEVLACADAPDGSNINADCGALHPEGLAARVVREGADLGVALDGDADRAILVDETGRLVDGDAVLFVSARRLRETGRLPVPVVVGTVMSNVGLEVALRREGMTLLRTAVGDRYVRERMEAEGATLGGEPSGHTIYLDRSVTGDGLLTGLEVAEAMAAAQAPLSALLRGFTPYPQLLRNLVVERKPPLEELGEVSTAVEAARGRLGETGRLVLRYSGTEPLLRLMVEGPDLAELERIADALSATLREALA